MQVTYDPARVSYGDLLRVFFRAVDPTDAGGQFCDRGDSYRTAVFATPSQKAAAQAARAEAQAALGQQVVTPVLPAGRFWPADDYHQDYYRSSDIIITRFGPRSKAGACRLYRKACGRDARLRELWGSVSQQPRAAPAPAGATPPASAAPRPPPPPTWAAPPRPCGPAGRSRSR